jgi:hypothetical protein
MYNLAMVMLPLNNIYCDMAYERINPILDKHQLVLDAIGNKIHNLRKSTGLSVERFCVKNDIPRISYTNLESGKNFHMTTLLKVLDAYPDVKTLESFFAGI